jgi:Zn-dependent M28 family amino/carboxypeptidase
VDRVSAAKNDVERLESRLRAHVQALAGTIGERSVFRPDGLEAAARYIARDLEASGFQPASQPFTALGREVRNIEAELSGTKRPEEIVVLGAHYDSVEGCPGANDNGSGVAALLELARALKSSALERTVRFVAFVNEEPPFFQGPQMGSVVSARRSRARGERIVGMISLETIGYYTHAPKTQQYPAPLGLLYPSTGNFIGMVGNVRSRQLLTRVATAFRAATTFPIQSAVAPASLPGVGWSDHWAYWQEGYPAIMLTDTAPYRYPHYHTMHDTPDKLLYPQFAQVVAGVIDATRTLARADR